MKGCKFYLLCSTFRLQGMLNELQNTKPNLTQPKVNKS